MTYRPRIKPKRTPGKGKPWLRKTASERMVRGEPQEAKTTKYDECTWVCTVPGYVVPNPEGMAGVLMQNAVSGMRFRDLMIEACAMGMSHKSAYNVLLRYHDLPTSPWRIVPPEGVDIDDLKYDRLIRPTSETLKKRAEINGERQARLEARHLSRKALVESRAEIASNIRKPAVT